MRKSIVPILIALGLISACNTMAGLGKDVQKAGEKVEDAAKKKQQ